MSEIEFGDENIIDLAKQENYEFPHPAQRGILPLVVLQSGDDGIASHGRALGTAFAVGQGILITATHVIHEVMNSDKTAFREDMELHALYVTADDSPEGTSGGPLKVLYGSFNPGHDLAVLTVETPPDSLTFSQARLSFRPPPVDSRVIALGYTDSAVTVDPPGYVELRQKVTASHGVIEEVFHVKRDSCMVRFPAAQGDFPAPSGLSGSPIFNEQGNVCGVVSSSTEPSAEFAGWTSNAALLPHLLPLTVETNDNGVQRSSTIQELIQNGVVLTDGSESTVQFTKYEDRIDLSWSPDA